MSQVVPQIQRHLIFEMTDSTFDVKTKEFEVNAVVEVIALSIKTISSWETYLTGFKQGYQDAQQKEFNDGRRV